jgi:putative transposase
MLLVEKHIIKDNNPLFKEIDDNCFLSKNLYNRANYIIRQEFINTSKEKELGNIKTAVWIRYNQIQKQLQNDKDFDYIQLPAKVAQQVLRLLDKNWVSFFKSIKDWKKNPSKYTGRPSLPHYKDKKYGRQVLNYTIQAISKPQLKKGFIVLSGTNIKIKTLQSPDTIRQVRITPKINHYVIEVIYKKQEVKNEKIEKNTIAGIDLGLDNLAALTSNKNNVIPLLINGRPLKAMNQYYNKQKAKLQAFVGNKSSNRLIKLTNKRNRKIYNYLHNASRYIVNYLIANNFETLVIGNNKRWKDEINIGKVNNQAFVNIPHARFINMLQYKCELVGIDVILREESYTSKCSFLDEESVEKHDTYLGNRRHRGLFISSNGTKINADCNGSGNITRKEFPNAFADGIEGVVVRPIRVTPYKTVA